MTTNQLPLPFDAHHLARLVDPDTSKDAARSAQTLRGDHHEAIMAVLRQGGDFNADELADRIGSLSRHQVGRRLGELEAAGMIEHTGNQRPTPSGRLARCFQVRNAVTL